MKKTLILVSLLFVSFAFASQIEEKGFNNEQVEILVNVDGEMQSHRVNEEALFKIMNHHFYECKAVPGGWRRCSKRNGRCFGATFRIKHQCEDALNNHDDDDN